MPFDTVAHPRKSCKGALLVYMWDAQVKRDGKPPVGGLRGKPRGLSEASKRHLKRKLRNAEAEWEAFVTLTYPREFPKDGRVVKRHLNRFLQEVSRISCGTALYLWGMEWQKRGAPHLHVVLSVWIPKEWLSKTWYRIVGSGDPRHLRAGTQVESPRDVGPLRAYFCTQYLEKGDSKQPPRGFRMPGRMWGCTRGLAKPKSELRLTENGGNRSVRLMRRAERARRGGRPPHHQRWRGGRKGMTLYGGSSIGEAIGVWLEREGEAQRLHEL